MHWGTRYCWPAYLPDQPSAIKYRHGLYPDRITGNVYAFTLFSHHISINRTEMVIVSSHIKPQSKATLRSRDANNAKRAIHKAISRVQRRPPPLFDRRRHHPLSRTEGRVRGSRSRDRRGRPIRLLARSSTVCTVLKRPDRSRTSG